MEHTRRAPDPALRQAARAEVRAARAALDRIPADALTGRGLWSPAAVHAWARLTLDWLDRLLGGGGP